jgi:Trehalase
MGDRDDGGGPPAAAAAVHVLARYWADWWQPRPESWREDAGLAASAGLIGGSGGGGGGEGSESSSKQTATDSQAAGSSSGAFCVSDTRRNDWPAAAQRLFHELSSAAESGWDFSSRWLPSPHAGLASCRTTQARGLLLLLLVLGVFNDYTYSPFHPIPHAQYCTHPHFADDYSPCPPPPPPPPPAQLIPLSTITSAVSFVHALLDLHTA